MGTVYVTDAPVWKETSQMAITDKSKSVKKVIKQVSPCLIYVSATHDITFLGNSDSNKSLEAIQIIISDKEAKVNYTTILLH